MSGGFVQPGPRSDLKWCAIDLDGTLAEPVWTPENPTSEIGDPIWPNVYKARKLEQAGYKVAIHTSRPWTDYEAIEAWCRHYMVPCRRIVPGKILAAIYIDDRALHANADSWIPGQLSELDKVQAQAAFWAAEAFRLARRAGYDAFGSHARPGAPRGPLEFDGEDVDGMPLWERLKGDA